MIYPYQNILDFFRGSGGLKIDGKDFEEVINHSYIVALN
jgi:hypothetical protein